MSGVIDTLADLVRINSVNPAYGDGGTEANVVPYVQQFFAARGIETFVQEVFPGRHNVIAVLPGKTSKRMVLEAHMDTVSIKGMSISPFEPMLRDGKLYGRGAVDDKAGLAAMMHAVASLKQDGVVPPCEVWLAAVVDEEFTFRGVVKLCEGLRADASIVAEPTEMKVVTASKGVLRWRIHTRGKAAHTSQPQRGRNAITSMARLVLALEADNQRMAGEPASVNGPSAGPGTITVSVINGGVQINTVPEQCTIEIDRRLLPSERAEVVLAHYQGIIAHLRALHADFEAEMEAPLLVDQPLFTDVDEPLVKLASGVLTAMGYSGEPHAVPFGSDASKLSALGVPTILFGPGSIDQAHAADEFVEIAQVEHAALFYRRCVESFGAA